MSGVKALDELLRLMEPRLDKQGYVFVTVQDVKEEWVALSLCIFREKEGTTLILDYDRAREFGLEGSGPFRRITLTVHSSLEAIGLTAAVSQRLAASGISANVVAAYFHDHVFVPAARADEAVAALRKLAKESRTETGVSE